VTRFKCPGCTKTYSSTAGIINHLKEKDEQHPAVEDKITQDATKVICERIDGQFKIVVSDIPIPPISQSLTQVYAIECGFLFEY